MKKQKEISLQNEFRFAAFTNKQQNQNKLTDYITESS